MIRFFPSNQVVHMAHCQLETLVTQFYGDYTQCIVCLWIFCHFAQLKMVSSAGAACWAWVQAMHFCAKQGQEMAALKKKLQASAQMELSSLVHLFPLKSSLNPAQNLRENIMIFVVLFTCRVHPFCSKPLRMRRG